MWLKTYHNIHKLNRIDARFMILISSLHFLLGVSYIYVVWREDYTLGYNMFFYLYYSFACGMSAALDLVLIRMALMPRRMRRLRMMLGFGAALQVLNMAVDIVYAFMYGEVWQDGYLWLFMEAFLLIMYLRRIAVLRQLELLILADMDYMAAQTAEGGAI